MAAFAVKLLLSVVAGLDCRIASFSARQRLHDFAPGVDTGIPGAKSCNLCLAEKLAILQSNPATGIPGAKSCNLCLAEKLAFLKSNPATTLNKRSDLNTFPPSGWNPTHATDVTKNVAVVTKICDDNNLVVLTVVW